MTKKQEELRDEIKTRLADTFLYRINKLDLHEFDIPECAESILEYLNSEVLSVLEELKNKWDEEKDSDVAYAFMQEIRGRYE